MTSRYEPAALSSKQLKVDGNFGPDTRNAVEALQRKDDLQIDGTVGPKTDAALTRALSQLQAAAAPGPANPDDRNHGLYKALQQKLPEDTSVEQLTRATVTAHANGITSADKLQSVVMQGDVAYMIGVTPGFRARLDLSQPAPGIDQSMAQLGQQQQPQEQNHLHNQRQSMG